MSYIPQIEKRIDLTEPIKLEFYVDNTDEFEFPYAFNQLTRILPAESPPTKVAGESKLGRKTITEGRSYTYPPVAFRRISDGTVFIDLQVKGGGTEINPNVSLFENKSNKPGVIKYDPKSPIPSKVVIAGRTLIVRYHTEPIVTLPGTYLGVHSLKDGLADMYMSKYLEEKGLRTRALVGAGELPRQLFMSTPNGEITVEEFIQKTGVIPQLELWCLRCKYRVHDILRYIYEVENPDPEASQDTGMKLHVARVIHRSGRKRNKITEQSLSKSQKKQIWETLFELAIEINRRARYDSDPRFVELSKRHESIDNICEFYTDYLSVFVQVLGEQFAIMERANAISGMFNPQNITLLAELVDHDVTMVGGKIMNSDGKLEDLSEETKRMFRIDPKDSDLNKFNQLFVGYDSIMKMLADLSRVGILNLSEDQMRNLLKKYLYYFKLSVDDVSRHLKMAKEKIVEVQSDRPDYFGIDSKLAFCEDVIEIFS